MFKRSLLLIFLCGLLSVSANAQVSVNPLTGAAECNIPVYTLKSGQIALTVSLSYSGSGVKTKDVEGNAGMGWRLNTGGQVSRIVRGLPDDILKDNANNQRLGWMSPLDTAANSIAGFTITNDGSTCTKETTDISYITAHFPFRDDTEPDQFYVSGPGLSCQLVYDRVSGKFKPVNYQDLIIKFGTDPTSHLITSFTITNDKGITYSFGNTSDAAPANNKVTRKTIVGPSGSVHYLINKFNQYQNGITYYDTWSLVNIVDANGNGIQLNYTNPSPSRGSKDSLAFYLGYATNALVQYYVSESNTPYTIQSIQAYNNQAYSNGTLSFSWTTSGTGQTMISAITGFGRSFQFGYSTVASPGGFARNFLRTFIDAGCSSPNNYQFGYAGETLSGGNYTTTLPDSTRNTYDYWGYYTTVPGASTSRIPKVYMNPTTTTYPIYSIAASDTYYTYTTGTTDRSVDAVNITAGSLIKITTANGGSTNIVYEPNDFYNVPSGTIIKGGGIRVKQITDSVGIHSTNNIVRNYSYLNPSTGVSSGKPISLPQFAFTIPGGTGSGLMLYTSATALSWHDLSNEDHTVMYSYFKTSQTGAGSILYQYNVPATYWDASATPSCSGCTTAEWYPTTDYLGRAYCSGTYAPMRNSASSYPFIANPNYDFERGLIKKVTNYNDAGTEVSESNYTYQRSNALSSVIGFKYDYDYDVSWVNYSVNYNKYPTYYGTSELTVKVVNKTFDSGTLTQAHSDSVSYTYGSAFHKLLTQQQTTNSDGSVLNSYYKYTKDYTATAGTNVNVTAIAKMQQKNINIPVETYQQLTMGGTTKTTAAALTLFRDTVFTVNTISDTLCLPSQQFKWIQTGSATFTPMTISAQTLTRDGGYFGTANYDIYDNTGLPLTMDDTHKGIATTLVHHFAGPIAAFSNAAYNQIAYADFDGDVASQAYGFTISGTGSYTPVGSHAGNAKGIASTQTVTTTSTLSKNGLAQNYIFSIWINAPAAGTLTLTLTGISTHPTISYATSGWKYYELKIPVGTLSSSYTVSFTASNSISIDDILFYPDVATASTSTYDANHYRIASTNTNGVSSYYTNDQWGRTVFVFDQDHNIVQKNTFITAADATTYSSPAISGPATVYNAVPTTFTITGPDPCAAAGTTVQWNFGDGTVVNAAGLISPTHAYHSLGVAKTITATVTSPLFGVKTATTTVTPATYSVPVSYTNYTLQDGHSSISSVTFTPVGGGTSYSFTGANLNGAHVNQGNYTISVVLSGGTLYNATTGSGYSCVFLALDNNTSYATVCANWTSSNSYSFALDITNHTALNFTVSQFDCSHFYAQ